MTKFDISVISSGKYMGEFEGATAVEAAEDYARDAGYRSFRDMCAITDPDDLDAAVETHLKNLVITPAYTHDDLILIRSDTGDGGWSLHLRGHETDGVPEILLSGEAELGAGDEWTRPDKRDYDEALSKVHS